jgi:hypothetical protein
MASFPATDGTESSSSMTMTRDSGDSGEDGDLGDRLLAGAETVSTLLAPFLDILTAIVQGFTAYQLIKNT